MYYEKNIYIPSVSGATMVENQNQQQTEDIFFVYKLLKYCTKIMDTVFTMCPDRRSQ